MELTNDELRERLALLKEIKELQSTMPDEDEMQAARDHLATLQELDKYSEPDEDDIVAACNHLATLQELEKYDGPDEDDITAASDHLATLREIRDREAA